MKLFSIFLTSVLLLPFNSFAQSSEKKLLNEAREWVNEIQDCDQYPTEGVLTEQQTNNPPVGNCNGESLGFFHVISKNNLTLVMKVHGPCHHTSHTSTCDVRFFLFSEAGKKLTIQKIASFESADFELEPIHFSDGTDLILISENITYGETAHVYGVLHGKIEELLSYEKSDVEHQGPYSTDTKIIPLNNKDLKLVITDSNEDDHSSQSRSIIYHFDPIQEKYTASK